MWIFAIGFVLGCVACVLCFSALDTGARADLENDLLTASRKARTAQEALDTAMRERDEALTELGSTRSRIIEIERVARDSKRISGTIAASGASGEALLDECISIARDISARSE